MPPATPKYFQQAMSPAAAPPPAAPKPKRPPLLRLELRDLSQPGAQSFLALVSAPTALEEAVAGVLSHLYRGLPPHCIPPTRSVTLVLRSMSGVAYTVGKDLDDDHKEIHFSTNYIAAVPEARRAQELLGVIRHEMVHCWQWSAKGTAPGGLIEGIADWVRLRSGLVPPHWKQEVDGDWDAGYQHTGYFLEYLEKRFGEGSVRRVNEALRERKYDEDMFWEDLFGEKVGKLWEDYGESFGKTKGEENGKKKGQTEGEEREEV
ncbi:BSP-domain-containing protein [Glonium stellatum]|uniref:BSP-domain-containing protein n=1 Tax=Glonium stellatum TaxID=574774 RepID=A0A8E2ET36_9PEZI|nr:BSP-domain-containing protein [Glonium stellatum]